MKSHARTMQNYPITMKSHAAVSMKNNAITMKSHEQPWIQMQ